MDALLLTTVMVLLILAALVLLARGWPASSRLGGYRARLKDRTPDSAARAQERGEATREDDDARWRWDDREGGDQT